MWICCGKAYGAYLIRARLGADVWISAKVRRCRKYSSRSPYLRRGMVFIAHRTELGSRASCDGTN